MSAERSYCPDWRDGAAYLPLLEADRSLLAWEWLRRDPQYRAAVGRFIDADRMNGAISAAVLPFGLVAFEPPELGVPNARPVWSRPIHPLVLPVQRVPETHSLDAFDVEHFGSLGKLIIAGGREHLLLSDGIRAIRLDGDLGTFSKGPVNLAYSIHGIRAAESPLLSLRRFLALARTGHFSRMLHPREQRVNRWILILRAADALASGASQREIAGVLLSMSASEPNWRSRDPSLRLKAQRIVHAARHFASGGYLRLLA